MCIFRTTDYNQIYSIVNFAGQWMEMPHTGLVIASKYNKVVVNLSNDGRCATSFPLWSSPPQSDSHEIIVIAHVNGNHCIRIDLREGFPLQITHPLWITYKSNIASGWGDKYVSRQNYFREYYYRDPKGFERAMLAVSHRWPVLLHGPAGAGKTALISRYPRHISATRKLYSGNMTRECIKFPTLAKENEQVEEGFRYAHTG
ncbi:FAR1-related sequence 5-like protein [Tanacetum coccineum]